MCEPSVSKKMRIDGAIDYVETQVGHDEVVELFPHVYRIGHFPFHDGCPGKQDSGDGDRRVRRG